MSARREMEQLVRQLQRAGFIVTRGGSGHWIVRPAEGKGMVVLAYSPSSSSFKKSLVRLKRIGYNP